MRIQLQYVIIAFGLGISCSALAQQTASPPATVPAISNPPAAQGAPIPQSDQPRAQQNETGPTQQPVVLKPAQAPQEQKPGGDRGEPSYRVGTEESAHGLNESIIANFTIVLAIATLLLMFFTGALWWETRKLAAQAQEAGKDTKRSLEIAEDASNAARISAQATAEAVDVSKNNYQAQNRAWVSTSLSLDMPYMGKTHLGVDGVYMNVNATAKNVGNSPATSVSFHAEIALLGPNQQDLEAHMNAYCDNIMNNSDRTSEVIFSGDTISTGHMVFISMDDIMKSMEERGIKMITPVVYGCINYKTLYSEGIKQTRFAYYVTFLKEGKPSVIMPDREDWLVRQLYLVTPNLMTVS